MKIVLSILFLVYHIAGKTLFAQSNLVYNPSFESLSNSTLCPTDLDQLNRCSGWFSVYKSPDYFNTCSTSTIANVPDNTLGYQTAAHGQAYAGLIIMMLGTDVFPELSYYREYFGTQLIQPLVPGTRYFLSMKISMAEYWRYVDPLYGARFSNVFTGTYCPTYMPCNNIGMKFTQSNLADVNSLFAMVNNSAHLNTPNVISDTTNWTTIHGSFIADSAYTHLVIGNFFTNANTDTITRNNGSVSYYFVDDVSVSTDSMLAVSIKVTLPEKADYIISPNPVKDKFFLEYGMVFDAEDRITISNSLGKLVYSANNLKEKQEIDISFLQSGIYYLKIQSSIGQKTLKVIKE